MKFEIGIVLSITHSKLLTDISNVYKILNYMLDDTLFTHQIPRACKFSKSFILTQHPQLNKWDYFNDLITPETWRGHLETAKMLYGKELEIEPIPTGVWTEKEPVEELQEIVSAEYVNQLLRQLIQFYKIF